MSRVTKIFGPPGTGKTTRLISLVEEAMKAGVRPERIAYVAFTRKAAHEAMTRAKVQFNLPEERFPYFRTLHSLAFKQLGIAREEMMHDDHYQEIGRMLGFRFSSMDETSLVPAGTELGDKVARIEALARLRGVTLETQWGNTNEQDCPWEAVKQWDAGVRKYKDTRGFFDFTDLLEQYNQTLDVDMFIVDEAQDLSPLQWGVVRSAASKCQKIYLAGDDDQAIYGWAGAEVERFLRLKGDVVILPQSYRIPSSIQALAASVINKVTARQPKDWHAREEEGRVDWVRYESSLELGNKKTWLLLARNRAQLKRFEKLAINAGHPYRIEGRHSTDTSTTHAIIAWEKGRKGEPVTPDECNTIFSLLGREPIRPREAVKLSDLLPADLLGAPWYNSLTRIPDAQREYLRACLSNGYKLLAEPLITISTIHRAKGGEADCVALIPDLSLKPWQQIGSDEELRVLYVALTRARESLTIIEPQSMRHYKL